MKGAARRNTALSVRPALKHRATTFIPWSWKVCRRREGEKIRCWVNTTTECTRERNYEEEAVGSEKKRRWQRWWGTRNEPSHKGACPPPPSFLILLLVPSEGVLSVVPLIDLSVHVMESADNVEFLCCILKVSTVASHLFPLVSQIHAQWLSTNAITNAQLWIRKQPWRVRKILLSGKYPGRCAPTSIKTSSKGKNMPCQCV